MRTPIAVQVATFDLRSVQPHIDTTRDAFERYLDYYRPKETRSKHGLMGPVGKILREVKSGRRDSESLKGYALRVHEAAQQYLSKEGLATLEEGINRLVHLLDQVPVTVLDSVVDRLDYGLYLNRRKKILEQRDMLNQQFRQFLQNRHQTPAALAHAWGEVIPDWDRLYVFGPKSKTYRTANESKRKDMSAFWDHLKAETAVPVETLLEEEEQA